MSVRRIMAVVRQRPLLFVAAPALAAVLAALGLLLYPDVPTHDADIRTVIHDSTTVYENSEVTVTRLGSIRNLRAGFVNRDSIFGTDDHFIYGSSSNPEEFRSGGAFEKIDPTITDIFKGLVARAEPVRRVRDNYGVRNIVVLDSGTRLAFYDHLYRSADGGRTWEAVLDFRGDTVGPLYNGIAVDANDNVYFGEYTAGGDRPTSPRLWNGTDDGKNWEVAHRFPPGEIFHVHSVQYDPHRNRLWVTTGDRDQESRLLYSEDDLNDLQELGDGSQKWRIVSLTPTEDYLYWGSDNDRTGSSIYRWDFANQRLDSLEFIGKPSYFSTALEDGTVAISTTYEPESEYTGAHNPEPTSDMWITQSGMNWHRVLRVPYEEGETQWGKTRARVVLPGGHEEPDLLYATPLETVDREFTTSFYDIEWHLKEGTSDD